MSTDQAPKPPEDGDGARLARYDFRKPERLSKDQLRSLQFLYDRFSRQLSTSLSAYLRTSSSASVVHVERLTYADFVLSLPETTTVWAVGLDPITGTAAFEIGPDAAYAIVYSMLGGSGPSTTQSRALTEIEQSVVEKVAVLILEVLATECRPFRELRLFVKGHDTRPQMLNIAPPGEPFAVGRFDLVVGETKGQFNLALPAFALEEIGLNSTHGWQRGQLPQAGVEREQYYQRLAAVPMPVEVAVESKIAASELLRMSVGDLITIGAPTETDVTLRVAGTTKFVGKLFSVGGMAKLRVESSLIPEPADPVPG